MEFKPILDVFLHNPLGNIGISKILFFQFLCTLGPLTQYDIKKQDIFLYLKYLYQVYSLL